MPCWRGRFMAKGEYPECGVGIGEFPQRRCFPSPPAARPGRPPTLMRWSALSLGERSRYLRGTFRCSSTPASPAHRVHAAVGRTTVRRSRREDEPVQRLPSSALAQADCWRIHARPRSAPALQRARRLELRVRATHWGNHPLRSCPFAVRQPSNGSDADRDRTFNGSGAIRPAIRVSVAPRWRDAVLGPQRNRCGTASADHEWGVVPAVVTSEQRLCVAVLPPLFAPTASTRTGGSRMDQDGLWGVCIVGGAR